MIFVGFAVKAFVFSAPYSILILGKKHNFGIQITDTVLEPPHFASTVYFLPSRTIPLGLLCVRNLARWHKAK